MTSNVAYTNDGAIDELMKAASEHCAKLKKKMLLEDAQGNGLMGMGRSGARIYYLCVAESDPRYQERLSTESN